MYVVVVLSLITVFSFVTVATVHSSMHFGAA